MRDAAEREIEAPKLSMAPRRNSLVRKTFAILHAFHGQDERLTSTELSQRAQVPKASGHRLVQTLEEIGVIVRDSNGRYRLGMLVVTLSNKVSIGELLRQAAQPILSDLAVTLGCGMHLGILENFKVTCLCKINGSPSFMVNTRMESLHENYCFALVKILLGSLSAAELGPFLLGHWFAPLGSRSITDQMALLNAVKEAKRLGYALDDEESADGMRCVAVPIKDTEGAIIAAVSVTDRAERLTLAQVEVVRVALRDAAAEIERKCIARRSTRSASAAKKHHTAARSDYFHG
jgi:DNA-binding IclR family transcriptional regulator